MIQRSKQVIRNIKYPLSFLGEEFFMPNSIRKGLLSWSTSRPL
jgi:hypothetical protein